MVDNKEKELAPTLVLKTLELNQSIDFVVDSDKPIKEGESRYGTWSMWPVLVKNATVFNGRGKEAKEVKNYTGKAILFPSKVLNSDMVKAINGKKGVGVRVTMTVEKGKTGGFITRYVVMKLSDGALAPSAFTPNEIKLINDYKSLLEKGYSLKFEDFIIASQDEALYGKITKERAQEIYSTISG